MLKKTLFINESEKRVVVDPEVTLAEVVRKQMFLTGTKIGCGKGTCGACTVIMNGSAVRSCILKMRDVPEDARIITIEGVGTGNHLHPIQLAWIVHAAAQCGFCAPGFIMSAKALLSQNQNPGKEEVREWFQNHHNVCRCCGDDPAVDAVMDAAKLLRGEITTEELWSKLKEQTNGSPSGSADAAVAKVTGVWDFGADLGLKLPEGTLHAKLVTAQENQSNILAIDTSEAEAMPGVYKILTYKDVLGTNYISQAAYASGSGRDGAILSDKKAAAFGDAVAMVLAFKPKLAEEAARKVKIKTESLIEGIPAAEVGDRDLAPSTGFAYLNEKGKLIIHTSHTDISHRELADSIGILPEKLTLVPNPAVGMGNARPAAVSLEGLLGVAALAVKKPVYLEL
ncbi:MAG: mop [Bacillota bacterium]|jgi:aldehyde oxidoreductase|nr:mop [Bacillota bacterium]